MTCWYVKAVKFSLNLLHVFAVNLGRLDILQRLKFTDMFLSLASCTNIGLVRLDGALAHLEAVHGHIHLHLLS